MVLSGFNPAEVHLSNAQTGWDTLLSFLEIPKSPYASSPPPLRDTQGTTMSWRMVWGVWVWVLYLVRIVLYNTIQYNLEYLACPPSLTLVDLLGPRGRTRSNAR